MKERGIISHDVAMDRANEEHEKFCQMLLDEPTEVEKHFVEAEKELKQIKKGRKSGSFSRPDRKNER